MAWRCQVEPYLKRIRTHVTACEPGVTKVKNAKVKGFKVKLNETVFFPEGGGQPGDSGKIFWDNKSVNVIYTLREGEDAIHLCDEKVDIGEVEAEIDWKRRFDHMQQHSGQHLISAIFEREKYGACTTSWNMGEEISFIELSRPVSADEVAEVEQICNEAIRNWTAVSVEIIAASDQTLRGAKELPDDFAGPIRVVNIEGVDRNMCCGTHVRNLSDVQGLKLLHAENGKKGKGIVWFVAGQRIFDTLGKSWNVQRTVCAQMSCQSHQLAERVQKMSLNLRQSTKDVRNMTRELADFTAKEILAEFDNDSEKCLISLHRKDVGPEFLSSCVEKVKHLTENGFVILLSCGEQKVGNIVCVGPLDVIDQTSKEILNQLEGKGNAKNGRIQAKVNNLNNLPVVYNLINDLLYPVEQRQPLL